MHTHTSTMTLRLWKCYRLACAYVREMNHGIWEARHNLRETERAREKERDGASERPRHTRTGRHIHTHTHSHTYTHTETSTRKSKHHTRIHTHIQLTNHALTNETLAYIHTARGLLVTSPVDPRLRSLRLKDQLSLGVQGNAHTPARDISSSIHVYVCVCVRLCKMLRVGMSHSSSGCLCLCVERTCMQAPIVCVSLVKGEPKRAYFRTFVASLSACIKFV